MLRILGGLKRGKRLRGPTGLEFRPATGRVKSFIFSYFYHDIQGSSVLDLFSGTGSLGIEALSRGASTCVFIEHNLNVLKLLKENISSCRFHDQANIIQGDVFQVLKRHHFFNKKPFDFIVADPPFKDSLRESIVTAVEENHILKQNGVLILEHEIHDEDKSKNGLILLKQKRFGHCVLSIYGYQLFT